MTNALWKADLRWHDGELTERYLGELDGAVAHFRRLLARRDLDGQLVAARLVSPIIRRSVYFSCFDVLDRQTHPEAPLDPLATDEKTHEAAAWRPPPVRDAEAAIDLTAKGLRAQRDARGWSNRQAAAALGLPVRTWETWTNRGVPRLYWRIVALAMQAAGTDRNLS